MGEDQIDIKGKSIALKAFFIVGNRGLAALERAARALS
jgi:hypothetical protein